MPPFTATCKTGTTSKADKNIVDYSVWMQANDIKRSWNPTTSSTTVLCEIAWEDLSDFITDMLGYSERVDDELHRVLPERCPYNESQYALSAELVQLSGFDPEADGDWPAFTRAVVQVTFAAPLYSLIEDADVKNEHERFCIFTARGVAENELIPGASLFFVDDTPGENPLRDVGIKTGRSLDLEIKWLQVPTVRYTRLASFANKVNKDDWVVGPKGMFTFAAESVLFKTWTPTPRIDALGKLCYDVTLTFSIRQDGRTWNKFWKRGSTPSPYVEVTHNGLPTGNKLFGTANFDEIFEMT